MLRQKIAVFDNAPKLSRAWRLNCDHACASGCVDEAVSGVKPPAGKGVVGLLSWHGLHFWVTVSPNQNIIIIIKIFDSWGFALDPNGDFKTFSKTYITDFGWDRDVVCVYFRQLRKDKFSLEKLNYNPDCMVSSMNFQNFLGRDSLSPLPSSLYPAQSRALLSIQASTSNLERFTPLVFASPSIHSQYVWSFLQTRGTR